jgi:hypothetical protein
MRLSHLFIAIASSLPFLGSATDADADADADDCTSPAPTTATCLTNADFAHGTLILDTPGDYKLCQDIVFQPNPHNLASDALPINLDIFQPNFEDDGYDPHAFGLGFFSAISITTSNVNLYLNCHSLEQSTEHALLQRFYAHIELASSPFLPKVGPHDFGTNFISATNVQILGPGRFGRSSHHAIHGNDNTDVVIRDVTFQDFEVAAVSLNNVDNLLIEDCDVLQNRQDVPVIGAWSGALFIRPYLDVLRGMEYSMTLMGDTFTAATAYDELTEMLTSVYEDVMTTGFISESNPGYTLFHNIHHVIDGPCYSFVVHGKGPAVGGIGFTLDKDDTVTSSNIIIQNNHIENMKCWTNEIPATVVDGVVQNDARGAILQLISSLDGSPISIEEDGRYRSNVVANAQIMVAKAIHEGVLVDTNPVLQTGVNTISPKIVEWASSESEMFTPAYRCNGDSMHHVSKGTMVIRVEDTEGFIIRNNTIQNVENLSPIPFDVGNCTDFHLGASIENPNEQQGGNIRGISVAAVTGFMNNNEVNGPKQSSLIEGNIVVGAWSKNSNVIVGIDIQGESSDIEVDFNTVDLDGEGSTHNNLFDNYIAFRMRENVVTNNGRGAVTLGENNDFAQGIQVIQQNHNKENDPDADLTKKNKKAGSLRALREAHRHVPMPDGFKNEWEYGGCPFARG